MMRVAVTDVGELLAPDELRQQILVVAVRSDQVGVVLDRYFNRAVPVGDC